ncbi:MAG: hypothetical protein C0599_07335 [Salinivirgaceae bacterium]|nr:MAG: hypothetical protein C0599_07335 [Salinivirgaceae bacterium]
MTRLILTLLHPILWLTKTLVSKKPRFYVPLKMNDKCYCKSGKIYKQCHAKKDKEKGKTAYYIVHKVKSQNPKLQKSKAPILKYVLLSEYKKKRLQKVYASDERVKKTLGAVDYGALYIMGASINEKIPNASKFETDYDVAFDEGTFDTD